MNGTETATTPDGGRKGDVDDLIFDTPTPNSVSTR